MCTCNTTQLKKNSQISLDQTPIDTTTSHLTHSSSWFSRYMPMLRHYLATSAQAMFSATHPFTVPDGPDADGFELPNYIACPEGPDNPWWSSCEWDGWCYSCRAYVSVPGKQDHDLLYDWYFNDYRKWHCKPCWGVWKLQQQTWKLEQQTRKLEQDLLYVASVPVPGLYDPDPDLD